MRVIQYNIGKFNWGGTAGIESGAAQKIANYNSFFATESADVLTMQEFVTYVDRAEQYNSDTAIFDRQFSYKSYTEKETAIKSQYAFADSAFSYLHTSGDPSAWCIYGNTTIHGRSVKLISGVLNVTANTTQKLRALTKLVDQIVGSSYNVIIGMDTNALSQSEADSMKQFMANHGFICANWGAFGYLDTYNLSWTGYKCIDNIFVRGDIEITNFTVPSVYSELSSDHFPVVADLILYA